MTFFFLICLPQVNGNADLNHSSAPAILLFIILVNTLVIICDYCNMQLTPSTTFNLRYHHHTVMIQLHRYNIDSIVSRLRALEQSHLSGSPSHKADSIISTVKGGR